ncbi:hypothetical protein N7533_007873 [Penicillium manginii]|uniref:uncharacterized protein n=1 Tax=Penicillium manginii TaxID=203109 RepID=UPI002548B419|nr:uncharacterized protein N7533_007873 [Penicillium manginii]KAJ5750845.1 hypothetical protein N7533_007873 [Penicillium manginii]
MPISPPSSREEFKISIICALTLEAKAVLPLFDSKYDENLDKYRRVPGDTNAYTLGNIGKYHVVLAHMPGPGKGFASSVASNVKRSYPCIELALVVGICGGVPHVRDSMSLQDDIFLGDVIVSNGVVQYDLGRRIPGDFVRKNTVHANLGRPSPEILSFLNKLDVGYDQLTHRLASYLVLVQEKFPSGYPGLEKDLLFSPDYEHERDNCKCTEVACCDDTVIVRRRDNTQNEHTTLVHFGLVASGDTVMMSAHDRERISEEENIIAFEMEGAGVWDNLPCIVIKGVSDYADSHKTKGWQRFAAASAAACMRAVLDEIPVPLPISSAGPSNTTELSESISQEDLQEDLEFYLGTLTFPRDELRVDEISSAHEKTCEWMMRHPEYLKWTSHVELPIHGGFFWIKGKPGAGKSTMMKYLLSKTERMLGDTVILSFFFYAQGTFLERSIIGMYRSLLHQLLLSERISENSMKRFWKLAKSLGSPKDEIEWTKRDVKGLLSLTIKSLKGCQIVILIDAVDECDQKEVEDMISFFQELGKSAIEHAVNMRVCLASRHYPRISLEKGIDLILEDEQEHENDLKKYVQTKLKVSSSKQAQEIRDTIIKRAAGVFLWVMLVIRLLNRAFDKGEIDTMKERLNQIPDELDDLFTDILTREQEDKEALIFSLQLLLFGFERLVTDEFYFALLFQKSGTAEEDIDLELHSLGFMSRRILDVTKGLTENITTKNSRVRFIHESVRDFLLKRNGFARILSEKLDPQRFIGCSHSRLAEFCFDYVSAVNRSQPGHKQAKLSSCFDCVSAANHPRPWHELQIEKTFGIELEPTRPPL